MKITILDGAVENPGDLSWEALAALGDLTVYDYTAPEEILPRIGDAPIILTNKTPITRQTMDECPNLRYIGVLATGFNVIDIAAAKEKGIVVANVPVEDSIVGLWAGALLTLLGYWSIMFFDKRNWHFRGRDFLLLLLSVGMIGFIYVAEVDYTPVVIWKIFYMDTILFSSLLGMLIYIGSQKLYQRMKAGNGGHAHFPFEKVVLPIVFLLGGSLYLTYFPI